MYQERKPIIGEVHRANTYGGQDLAAPQPDVQITTVLAAGIEL